jgi:hypothetical protein
MMCDACSVCTVNTYNVYSNSYMYNFVYPTTWLPERVYFIEIAKDHVGYNKCNIIHMRKFTPNLDGWGHI